MPFLNLWNISSTNTYHIGSEPRICRFRSFNCLSKTICQTMQITILGQFALSDKLISLVHPSKVGKELVLNNSGLSCVDYCLSHVTLFFKKNCQQMKHNMIATFHQLTHIGLQQENLHILPSSHFATINYHYMELILIKSTKDASFWQCIG